MKAIIMLIMGLSFHGLMAAENCGRGGNYEIEKSLEFLKSDFPRMVHTSNGFSQDDIISVDAKLQTLKIECSVEGPCRNRRVGGFHSTKNANKIIICYHNIAFMEPDNGHACSILGTVLHEAAHAAGIEIHPNHNHGPVDDKVYRFGQAAEMYCHLKPEWNEEIRRGLSNLGSEIFEGQGDKLENRPVPNFPAEQEKGTFRF